VAFLVVSGALLLFTSLLTLISRSPGLDTIEFFLGGTMCFSLVYQVRHGKGDCLDQIVVMRRPNTGNFPEVETLIRPSDLPPSNQQAELLRAAQDGKETPAEELLRANTNSTGE